MGCLQSTTAVEDEDSAGTNAPGSAPALEYASSCAIPTAFKSYPLVGISKFNHDTSFFEFGLEPGQSLNLPVCSCLLMRGKDSEGEAVVRPYTPTSDDQIVGKFQLLIKSYGEQGKLSKYVHSLQVGDAVEFKHVSFNVKLPLPSPGVKKIAMLAGGTGVTPMFQALRPGRRCHSLVYIFSVRLISYGIMDVLKTA
jgi:cytochrome-b5 reductase